MAEANTNRRLAAILAADVAGYSRLMGADEEGTLARLTAHRRELLDPTIAKHRGRIVKTTGDGLLAEFGSVLAAVRCAAEVQAAMAERNLGVIDGQRIAFRIGINVGDVVEQDNDIFGDGVNVAVRLEGAADPGGICVSARVQEDAAGRVDLTFEDMGELQLKNIARPVRAFRVLPAALTPPHERPRRTAPDKPSIAVLPFVNMSGDAEQEYFADGISEDIITGLSRLHWLFVIARNSTFAYKGEAIDVRKLARELGVRYVLEGSVRRAGNRIRITGQLIDGETGNHLWAEKYDRNLEDVFEIQDEITQNIVGALEPQMVVAEDIRSRRKNVQNLDAWDLVIQALARIGEFSERASEEAIELLDRAIGIDPTYARAYSQKARTLAWQIHQGWKDIESTLPMAIDAAEMAIRYDPDEPWAYIAWTFIAPITRDADKLFWSARKAIELNPNFALAHSNLGAAYALTGRGDQAFEWIEKARRLSPRDIFRDEFDVHTGMAHFQLGDYRKAAEFAARASMPRPEHVYPHLILASSYGHLGALDAAREEVSRIARLAPDFSLATADKACVFVLADDRGRFLDGLRKAGLPE
jgi:adenylate cyclase